MLVVSILRQNDGEEKKTKGGAVDVERSRSPLVREINEKQKITGLPEPEKSIFKNPREGFSAENISRF